MFIGIFLELICGFLILYRYTGKNKLVLIPAVLCVIFPRFQIIPFMHLFLIWAILYSIIWLFLREKKKEYLYWGTGAAALLITLIYLGSSYFFAHHVYETDYKITTDKDVPPVRVALIADTHLGCCFDEKGMKSLLQEIEETDPDMLVIVGDFVDDETEKKEMIRSCYDLGQVKTTYGVFYVPGNHDAGYYSAFRGFSYEDLLNELRANGITVLEDQAVPVGDNYIIVGRNDYSMEREEIEDLMTDVDPDLFSIVLDHQPNDFTAETEAGCDLVLSGHTHGGHMFPIAQIAEVFYINDLTYGIEQRGDSTFIVTSGMSNWAIPFKSAAISEYCIIDIS